MVGARGEHCGNWAVIVEDKGHRTKFKSELRLGAPTSRVAQIRPLDRPTSKQCGPLF
jgi:hypothetical protein